MENSTESEIGEIKRKDGIYHFACSESKIKNDRIMCTYVNNRPLALFYYEKEIYALDARCYHAGGPLWQGDIGDIEDFGPVITCPFHGYRITLKKGERLYKDMSGTLKIAGKRQRTHRIKVKHGRVYVRVSTPEKDGDAFDCDRYSTYAIDSGIERKELKFTKY